MLLIVFFTVVLAFPFLVFADPDRERVAQLAPSVLKVNAFNTDGSISEGSGVTVTPSRVVTNCHVIKDATLIEVVKDGHSWKIQFLVSDVERDLCLLIAPNAYFPAARIGNPGKLRVGQPVVAINYTGGEGPGFSNGRIVALYNYEGSKVIQSSTPFGSGASGGGLFDERGFLVGILSFRHKAGGGHYFALPVDWFNPNLTATNVRSVEPFDGGTSFWQLPSAIQPFFLQAAALEAENKWDELLRLAEKWSKLENTNAESWFVLGKAYSQLKRNKMAITAYRKAISIHREYAEVWYHLGLVYVSLGRKNELEDVREVLFGLNEQLANQLPSETMLFQKQ